MITAEHWVNQQFSKQIISEDIYASKQGIIEVMVIFAQLHVEAALKEASKKARFKEVKIPYEGVRAGGFYIEKIIDEESILNSYNINEMK